MKLFIFITILIISQISYSDVPKTISQSLDPNQFSALVGNWCLESQNREYDHELTLTGDGTFFGTIILKTNGDVDESKGTWMVDSNQFLVTFSNDLQSDPPRIFPFEKSKDDILKIDLKDGDPVRIYKRCEFFGV